MRDIEIHPTAVVAPSAKLGDGVIVKPYAIINEFVEIGENTSEAPFNKILIKTSFMCFGLSSTHQDSHDLQNLGQHSR